MKLADLRINRDERAAIIGKTGTGKSFLAKRLIGQPNLETEKHVERQTLIIDSKRTFKIDGYRIVHDPKHINLKKDKFIIYRPDEKFLTDLAAYNEVYKKAYLFDNKGKGILVYTDDLVGIMTNTRYPHYLQVCYQMGRERLISMISCVQMPVYLPRFTMTECEKFFAFKLIKHADIKRVEECIPGYSPEKLSSLHSFAFYDNKKELIDLNMRIGIK